MNLMCALVMSRTCYYIVCLQDRMAGTIRVNVEDASRRVIWRTDFDADLHHLRLLACSKLTLHRASAKVNESME